MSWTISRTKILVAVAVLAVGGWFTFRYVEQSRGPQYEFAEVRRGDVKEQVSETGKVVPGKKIALQAEASGRVTTVSVKEGDEVEADTVLIEIDARDLNARIASQRAAVESAEARLAELVAGPTAQEVAAADAAVATATARRDAAVVAQADAATALDNARTNLAVIEAKAEVLIEAKLDALDVDLGEAVTVMNDALDRLTLPLFTSNDQLTFTSLDSLAETDARNTRGTAKASRDAANSTIASARAAGTAEALLAAQTATLSSLGDVKRHLEADLEVLKTANLDTTTKTTYQQNVNAALTAVNASTQKLTADLSGYDLQVKVNEAEVTAARIAVANAESALNARIRDVTTAEKSIAQAQADLDRVRSGTRPETIAAQRAQVSAQKASLQALLAELSKRWIVAPNDGIVTDVHVEKGETLLAGTVAAEMMSGSLEIETDVSELDIRKIGVGMPVGITFDALGPTAFSGKVREVAPREKLKDEDIFYKVTVALDEPPAELRSGMTADLSFTVGEKSGVLVVPERLVSTRAGKTYVRAYRDGKMVEVEVRVGLRGDDVVEIEGGLEEGEKVVVRELE